MKTPITCKLPRHRWIVVVALGALCGGELVAQKKTGAARDARKNEPDSFVICYNPAAPVRQLAQYSLIVVDYAYPRAAVAVLRKQQKTVLGYLLEGIFVILAHFWGPFWRPFWSHFGYHFCIDF